MPVSVEEAPGVGTTSGILTIVSPQLANEAVDLPFELTTRFWSFWLFVVIALGILTGYKFRTRLDARRARLNVLATAQQRESDLDALIEAEKDDGIRGELEQIRGTLKSACGPTAAPDSIDRAAQAAAAATTDLLTRKSARQASIQNRIATLALPWGPTMTCPRHSGCCVATRWGRSRRSRKRSVRVCWALPKKRQPHLRIA